LMYQERKSLQMLQQSQEHRMKRQQSAVNMKQQELGRKEPCYGKLHLLDRKVEVVPQEPQAERKERAEERGCKRVEEPVDMWAEKQIRAEEPVGKRAEERMRAEEQQMGKMKLNEQEHKEQVEELVLGECKQVEVHKTVQELKEHKGPPVSEQ
jgi:hypothetical protein